MESNLAPLLHVPPRARGRKPAGNVSLVVLPADWRPPETGEEMRLRDPKTFSSHQPLELLGSLGQSPWGDS
jgi:hypothetical protein